MHKMTPGLQSDGAQPRRVACN